jgi:hypothetical protein
LYPDVAAGIISDGTCFGPSMKLDDWDVYGQKWFKYVCLCLCDNLEGFFLTRQALLEKCKADPFCSSYLTSDPATFVKESFAQIENGKCKDILETV